MFKIVIIFGIVFVAILTILIVTIHKVGKLEKFLEILQPNGISTNSRNDDMMLFNSELDKIFYIVIYRFITAGVEFRNAEGTVFKTIGKMDYRKMLEAIYLNETIDIIKKYDIDNKTVIAQQPILLKNLIIESVYRNFIAKASSNIKNLFYKYYSGYDIDTYFVKKKGKPSLLPYITEYVNGKICILYLELLANDQKIFNDIQQQQQSTEDQGPSSKYTTALNDWSEKQFTKLSLLIYNIYGSEDALPDILKKSISINLKPVGGNKE